MDTKAAEPARAEQQAAGPAGRAAGIAPSPGYAPTSGYGSVAMSSPMLAVGGTALPILELQRMAGNRAVAPALLGIQRAPEDAPAPALTPNPTTRGSWTGVGGTLTGNVGAGGTLGNAGTTGTVGTAGTPGPGTTKRPKRMTAYLGMNPDAGKEVKALEKAAGKDAFLATTGDAALEAKLAEDPAISEFVFDDLKIPRTSATRAQKAIDTLISVAPKARDSLGQLMRWMSQAEEGEIILDRLVLSGHSNGFELWGTTTSRSAPQKPGILLLERDFGNVAEVFPVAARQVRSIMFSACETVGAVESMIRTFPNLESVWSYGGFSPDIAGGSSQHIEKWEKATEEGGTPGKKDARGAAAIWTKKDKWLVGDPGKGDIETLYTQVMSKYHGVVDAMLKGQKEIDQPALNALYGTVQDVSRHPGLKRERKAIADEAVQVILRLRHWKAIRTHFATDPEFGPTLVKPYEALGIPMPNWATIGRAELFAHLRQVDKLTAGRKDTETVEQPIRDLVYLGLFKLDPNVIPSEWN